MKENKPEMKFKAGGLSATVWENTTKTKSGEDAIFKSISFDKRFKDKDGTWKSTNTLRLNDIPKAIAVLTQTYNYLLFNSSKTNVIEEEVVF